MGMAYSHTRIPTSRMAAASLRGVTCPTKEGKKARARHAYGKKKEERGKVVPRFAWGNQVCAGGEGMVLGNAHTDGGRWWWWWEGEEE